jgi:predicted acylesterase/phospholipase RssA
MARDSDRRESEAAALDRILGEAEQIEESCRPGDYRVLTRLVGNPENHLAIGFGGGSVPGLAGNCALARILEELELLDHVKEVWGTSAGSVVGAGWSGGADALTILEQLGRMKHADAVDVPRWELFVRGAWRFLRSRAVPEGFIRGEAFRKAIQGMLPVSRFEDTRFPYRVIACTDDGRARKVVFREGEMINAVMASMCIPGVMCPVSAWDGSDGGYFDGGVVEKTPLVSIMEEHGRANRSSQLLVLCTHYSAASREQRPQGFAQRFVSTITVLEEIAWEAQRERAFLDPGVKAIVLNPHFEYGTMFDFERVRFLYLCARKAYKQQLSNAGLSLRFEAR